MLSIIGTLIGLFGSLLPKLLDYFKVKEDHKHELAVLKVQAEMAQKEHEYRIEEINTQADIASEQAVYKMAEQKYTGVRWIDAILALYSGTIRPTITYAFTCGYFLVKVAQYQVITASSSDTWGTIWKLWNSEDMAAFMTIIGFWFGGRILKSNLEFFGKNGNGNGNGITSKHSQPSLTPITTPIPPVTDPLNPLYTPKPGESQ